MQLPWRRSTADSSEHADSIHHRAILEKPANQPPPSPPSCSQHGPRSFSRHLFPQASSSYHTRPKNRELTFHIQLTGCCKKLLLVHATWQVIKNRRLSRKYKEKRSFAFGRRDLDKMRFCKGDRAKLNIYSSSQLITASQEKGGRGWGGGGQS